MTDRKDDVLVLASLEGSGLVNLGPETAEIVSVPDDLIDRFVSNEVEGLEEDPEGLEMLRLTLHRFKRLHEAEIKKRIEAIKQRGIRAYVYWQRRKMGEHQSGRLIYIAEKPDANNTNIQTSGKLPNFQLNAIGVGFDVVQFDDTVMADINAAIRSGRFILKRGTETVIDIPLSMVADYHYDVSISLDGNTSPTVERIYVSRNSKLERGMLPVRGIYFSEGDTVSVEITGLDAVPSSSTTPMTVLLSGYVRK